MRFPDALRAAVDLAGKQGLHPAAETRRSTFMRWSSLGNNPLVGISGATTLEVGDVLHHRLDGDMQIMAIVEADRSAGLSAATTYDDDVAVVFVSRDGQCSVKIGAILVGGSFTKAWFHPASEDAKFWGQGWAMVIQDGIVNDSDVIGQQQTSKSPRAGDDYKVGDDVAVMWAGRHKGKLLGILSVRGVSGLRYLVGSSEYKHTRLEIRQANNWAWLVDINSISNLSSRKNPESDSSQMPGDGEGDALMKFFASSSHDTSSPWYSKDAGEGVYGSDDY